MLGAYLLTCEKRNLLGCFFLPVGYMADDLCWPLEKTIEAVSELSRKGFVRVCERSRYLFIPDYLEWNKIENPNQAKAAVKIFRAIPKQFGIFQQLAASMLKFGAHWPKGFETVLEGYRNQEQEQEQNKEETPLIFPPCQGGDILPVKPEPTKKRKKRKVVLNPDQQARFNEFYHGNPEGKLEGPGVGYIRKEDPARAEEAWAEWDDGSEEFIAKTFPAILEGRDGYRAMCQRDHKPRDWIKLPATWLNARGWESDYTAFTLEPEKELNPYEEFR